MKPLIHATISAKKFGGVPEDYQAIHDFFDWSKIAYPHMKHRAILHNSFGIYLCERIFGIYITNADGDKVSVRDVAEQHVLDDLGRIPTVQDWLEHLTLAEPWMRAEKKSKTIKLDTYLPDDLNEKIEKKDTLKIELTEDQKQALDVLAEATSRPDKDDFRKVVLDGAARRRPTPATAPLIMDGNQGFRESPGVSAVEVDDGTFRPLPKDYENAD